MDALRGLEQGVPMMALSTAIPPTVRHKIQQNLFVFLPVPQQLVFLASSVFDSKPKLEENFCTTREAEKDQAKTPE
jgi:hypothetical protein